MIGEESSEAREGWEERQEAGGKRREAGGCKGQAKSLQLKTSRYVLRLLEQIIPEFFSFFSTASLPALFLKPKVIAVVGPVFFLHIVGLRFSAPICLCFVVKDTIKTDSQIGTADGTFVAARDKFQGYRAMALVTCFHTLPKRSLKR